MTIVASAGPSSVEEATRRVGPDQVSEIIDLYVRRTNKRREKYAEKKRLNPAPRKVSASSLVQLTEQLKLATETIFSQLQVIQGTLSAMDARLSKIEDKLSQPS